MKFAKRYLCLFITIVLGMSLVACSQGNSSIVRSWDTTKPLGDLCISAEIVSNSTVDIDSEFEIKIGIGRSVDQYPTAEFRVDAPELTIFASDGTQFDGSYQIKYEDFDDSKYGLILNDDNDTEVKHFESLRFKYSGKEQNAQGSIDFQIVVTNSDGKELAGQVVSIYYKVNNGKITLSTKRPVDHSPENKLTQVSP